MTNEEIVLAEEANNFISRPRCIESLKIALCVYGFFCIMAFGITGGIWMLMGKRLDECRTPRQGVSGTDPARRAGRGHGP